MKTKLILGGIILGSFIAAVASTNYYSGSIHVAENLRAANLASTSTITAVSIAATGWTNIWSTNNAVVYVERSGSVVVTVKNTAGTTLATLATGTTPLTISLQPGWGFSASASLSGKAVPF